MVLARLGQVGAQVGGSLPREMLGAVVYEEGSVRYWVRDEPVSATVTCCCVGIWYLCYIVKSVI